MQEPFPHQGVVNTHQQQPPQNDTGGGSHEIYMAGKELFFQTRNRNYDTPSDIEPSGTSMSVPTTSLNISKVPIEPLPKTVKEPMRRSGHHSKATHSYRIIYDLAQSPVSMSSLEVFQSCPRQRKALISALGAIDPSDSRIVVFDLDKASLRLPSLVTFQIPVLV